MEEFWHFFEERPLLPYFTVVGRVYLRRISELSETPIPKPIRFVPPPYCPDVAIGEPIHGGHYWKIPETGHYMWGSSRINLGSTVVSHIHK